jgi:hypothetical protein
VIIITAIRTLLLRRYWRLRVYIWTVKDSAGSVMPNFMGASRLDVERKLVPTFMTRFVWHVSHPTGKYSNASWGRFCHTSAGKSVASTSGLATLR